MAQIGFDNEKYLHMQSEHIRNRISKFGGKLFDDYERCIVIELNNVITV